MVAHRVLLRVPAELPPLFGASATGPALLERTDANFVKATLAELEEENAFAGAYAHRAAQMRNGKLCLYQPVHRVFHLAMIEAVCEADGFPRLDAEKIDSSGLVVRRIRRIDGRDREQAWTKRGAQFIGWRTLDGDETSEPEHVRRPVPRIGHPELDRRLRTLLELESFSENISPLFPVAPALAKRIGRTLLFGLVPLAPEAVGDVGPSARFSTEDVRASFHLFAHLRPHSGIVGIPAGGTWLTLNGASALGDYLAFLRFLGISLDFNGSSSQAATLRAAFAGVFVEDPGNPSGLRAAAEHLAEAIRVFVYREGGAAYVPAWMSGLSEAQAAAIAAAALPLLDRRMQQLEPVRGKYEDPDAEYVVRAFVRVRDQADCPPHTWWSEPSARFTVRSWFESGPLPPVTVQLPELADFDQLKPNVAFQVPGALMDLLGKNRAQDMLNGNISAGVPGLQWICGFNIPIITICAFIMLTIILHLLDIVFRWVPFVRICIPLPSSFKENR